MKVYTLALKESSWNAQDERLMKFVSSERHERVKRYRYSIDQKLSLYSELLTIYTLEKALGRSLPDIIFSKTSTGKPFFAEEPQWHFNTSHSGRRIICGIANQWIGVDVEKIGQIHSFVSDNCFHKDEQLKLLLASSKEQLFYEIWTRKEAFVKYDGNGIAQDLTKINVYDPKKLVQFHSWYEENYQYSSYTNKPEEIEIIDVSMNEVEKYLLKDKK